MRECTDADDLNALEILYISEYNATNRDIGYNISTGGQGGDMISIHPQHDDIVYNRTGDRNAFFGHHHSSKTKATISKKNKNRSHSEETKNRISESMKEQYESGERIPHITEKMRRLSSERMKNNNPALTPENIEKSRQRMLADNPMNHPEYRQKVRESKLGGKNPMAKKWILTSPDGDIFTIEGNISDFCNQHGLSANSMWNLAGGKSKQLTHKGWTCKKWQSSIILLVKE